MRGSSEMYHEVACRCSAYNKKCADCAGNCSNAYDENYNDSYSDKSENSYSDSYNDSYDNSMDRKSCLTCTHFTNNEYCELDLYDPIARDL